MSTRAHRLSVDRSNPTGWPRLGAGRRAGRDMCPARRRAVCLAVLVIMLETIDRQTRDERTDHADPPVAH